MSRTELDTHESVHGLVFSEDLIETGYGCQENDSVN
jgi:hypothetical protein